MSCSDSRHYLLSAQQPQRQPLASFSGYVNGSFYIRACFSGDGSHILSGSSDHKAYIWEVSALMNLSLVIGALGLMLWSQRTHLQSSTAD